MPAVVTPITQEPPPRTDGFTEFVAIRNFLRAPSVHVTLGDVLLLDDKEAANLVNLDAVEPRHARDRKRLMASERVTWEMSE